MVPQGADPPAGPARRLENRRAELDDRRLAVRAGDADERQVAIGVAVERRGEVAEQGARFGNGEPGDPRRRLGRARAVGEHRHRAALECLAGEQPAVELRPAPGDEELSRLDRARVVTNAEDLGVGPEVSGDAEILEEGGQPHPPAPLAR